MSTGATRLTAEDLAFLERPLHGFLTTADGPAIPQPRPVWYEATAEGTVQLFTGPDTARMRHLRNDARASLVVAAPAGERERWLAVAGPTTIETDGVDGLIRRLAERYWDLDDSRRAKDLAEILDGEWARVVIHPETIYRYHFA